jgi:cytoskeletal protein CcmA (bactofilin family)
MGFFGSKREVKSKTDITDIEEPILDMHQEISYVRVPNTNLSMLNSLLNVKSDIKGRGSLVIGGEFEGSVDIEDTLYIEKDAKFKGKVKAKSVKISGEFKGEIEAKIIENSASSKFYGIIKANKTFIAGIFEGIVNSKESVEILPSGEIRTKEIKSASVKVGGKVKGNVIASSLLEVSRSGSIKGEIVTRGIKTEQGGSIVGNIQTYDESLHGIDIEYTLDDLEEKENTLPKAIEQLSNSDIQKYAKKDKKSPRRL